MGGSSGFRGQGTSLHLVVLGLHVDTLAARKGAARGDTGKRRERHHAHPVYARQKGQHGKWTT